MARRSTLAAAAGLALRHDIESSHVVWLYDLILEHISRRRYFPIVRKASVWRSRERRALTSAG